VVVFRESLLPCVSVQTVNVHGGSGVRNLDCRSKNMADEQRKTDTVVFTVLDGDAELVLGEGTKGDTFGLCEIEPVCVILGVTQQ